MIVGVIGSGSIGPDLAYGFVSALAKGAGGKVYLHRHQAGGPRRRASQRIQGYVEKGVSRGKLSPKVAAGRRGRARVRPPTAEDLADCDYVLEAATEDLAIKQVDPRRTWRQVVRPGLPDRLRHLAASRARRSPPRPSTPSAASSTTPSSRPGARCRSRSCSPATRRSAQRMLTTLKTLGKVPIVTADVPCFAADDIFCNYCAEAARIVDEGTGDAGPGRQDRQRRHRRRRPVQRHGPDPRQPAERPLPGADAATRRPAATGSRRRRSSPSRPTRPGTTARTRATRATTRRWPRQVLDRILAVLLGRTYFVVDNGICDPRELNWLTRNALGFRKGLLDLAEELGAERVHEICTAYAAEQPRLRGAARASPSKQLPDFYRNVEVERDGDIAVVTICRPEVHERPERADDRRARGRASRELGGRRRASRASC